MTQAYYFTKQNVDFEKFSDVTKDVLFNEFLKNEKYSNIINPFFNKIKDEFISTYNNIKDIQLYIPNENIVYSIVKMMVTWYNLRLKKR